MLSIAPGKVRTGRRSVCLVTPGGLNQASPALRGHAVGLREQGCRVQEWSAATDGSTPQGLAALANPLALAAADASDRARWGLEAYCQTHAIDEVVFSSLGGLGFRAIQAKRAGVAFAEVRLSVLLDEDSVRRRQEAARLADVADLGREFAERYAFENADARVCPDADLLEAVLRRGWRGANEGGYPRPDGPRPLVTVCLAHFNHGAYLPEALAALAAQTYTNLEVLVIDDGSTDPASREVFSRMEQAYPQFRFVRQENAGIGATRNRGLREARGEFFIPVDADNVARPDMIERLAGALLARPGVAAVSCYFLAFAKSADIAGNRFLYAYRPTAGPHVLACLQNVYGDANGLFRTEAFRSVGGFEVDRGTSFEDWEAFVKLAHAGHRIDVVPEHLFYYRHLQSGFSRTTNAGANHQRVLRQFARLEWLPPDDRESLWTLLAGLHERVRWLTARQHARRYRVVDWLAGGLARGWRLLRTGGRDSGTNRGG